MQLLPTKTIHNLRPFLDLHSLQTRLTTGVVLAALVGIGGIAIWMGGRMQQILLDSHKHKITTIAARLEDDVNLYSNMMPTPEALQKVIDYRSTGDMAIWVKSASGQVVAQSETLTMGSWQAAGVSQQLLTFQGKNTVQVIPVQTWVLVLCVSPLTLEGLGSNTLYVAEDITADYTSLQHLIRTLALISSLVIGVIAMVVALYIRHTLRPIRNLNRLASTVTADTLGHHPLRLEAAPTEVQELARSYNLMLDRLARAWQQQKRFVNDLSHELRTPLSLVQGYLDSSLRRCSGLTPPQREGLEIAAHETERTVRMLQELIDLARLENQQISLQMETIDLKLVLTEAVAMATADFLPSPTIPDRPMIATEIGTAPVLARIDRTRFNTVMLELLDNALRYSAPGQTITARLQQQGHRAIVQVEDQGPGIPLIDQQTIFEPFYRVDANRSRRSGGTGLGLTLVKALVEAMAGQIEVQSRPGHGSLFTISLPIEDQSL